MKHFSLPGYSATPFILLFNYNCNCTSVPRATGVTGVYETIRLVIFSKTNELIIVVLILKINSLFSRTDTPNPETFLNGNLQ